jgi:hypothetical protein
MCLIFFYRLSFQERLQLIVSCFQRFSGQPRHERIKQLQQAGCLQFACFCYFCAPCWCRFKQAATAVRDCAREGLDAETFVWLELRYLKATVIKVKWQVSG